MKQIYIKDDSYYLIGYELISGGLRCYRHEDKKKASKFTESDYDSILRHMNATRTTHMHKIEKEEI